MLEVGRDLDLGEEPLDAEHGAEVGFQNLERDVAVVAQVAREVDGGHAARADLTLDLVVIGERGAELGEWVHASRGMGGGCDGRDGDEYGGRWDGPKAFKLPAAPAQRRRPKATVIPSSVGAPYRPTSNTHDLLRVVVADDLEGLDEAVILLDCPDFLRPVGAQPARLELDFERACAGLVRDSDESLALTLDLIADIHAEHFHVHHGRGVLPQEPLAESVEVFLHAIG